MVAITTSPTMTAHTTDAPSSTSSVSEDTASVRLSVEYWTVTMNRKVSEPIGYPAGLPGARVGH